MTAAAQSSSMVLRGKQGLVLATAAVLFIVAQISIDVVNGWWSDELFALWASDPSRPFLSVFRERIAPDSNPPLYFSALYVVRQMFASDRLAVLALNVTFILAASIAVLMASRRSHMRGAAVVAVAVFVLSGPVLAYAAEGRSYLAALATVFCSGWYAVLAISEPERGNFLLPFVVVGALGALTHPFAALFCGALAAGLLVLALLDASRRDLVLPALALGISTTVIFAVWLALAWGAVGNIGWLVFTVQAVRDAVWYVRKLAVGSWFAAAILMALVAYGCMRKSTRPFVIVFGVAFTLFVVLPLAWSFKQPLIAGRYWMIGAPGIIVLVVALAATWYREALINREARASRYAFAAALLLAVVTTVSGFLTARAFTAAKPFWEGARALSVLLKDCPAGSVHVGTFKLDKPTPSASLASFTYMSGASRDVFVDVGTTTPLRLADARCPALAWAEHVQLGDDFATRLSDSELLRLMKIDGPPDAVDVRRHASGFVILKRGSVR